MGAVHMTPEDEAFSKRVQEYIRAENLSAEQPIGTTITYGFMDRAKAYLAAEARHAAQGPASAEVVADPDANAIPCRPPSRSATARSSRSRVGFWVRAYS